MVAVHVLSTAVDTVKEQMPKILLLFVRPWMHVDDDITCFPKEGWTFIVFGSENDLNFMTAKSCVTCVAVDSS